MIRTNPTVAQRIARRHALEDLERFDRELVRVDLTIRAALSAAMASTGTEGEGQSALGHLDNLLQDTFGPERKKLLAQLDDEGGADPDAHAWPIQDDDASATVIPFVKA